MEKGEFLEVKPENKKELSLEERISKVLKEKGAYYICQHLDEFPEFSHKEIAMSLIKAGEGYTVAWIFNKFSDLDKETAMALIKVGHGYIVPANLEKFSGLDYKEVAMELIKTRDVHSIRKLAENLAKFHGLDKEVAINLMNEGQGYAVAANLNKFSGLNHKEFALALIKTADFDSIEKNLYNFSGLDKEVAMALLDTRGWYIVWKNLNKFSGLDKEVVTRLVNTGQGNAVAENLEKFSGLDYNELALELIKRGDGRYVIQYLKKFRGLNHKEVLLALLKREHDSLSIYEIKYFKNFNFREFDKDLIVRVIGAAGDGHYEELFDNLILSEHQKREILHYLLLRNDFQKSKTFVEKLLANQPNVYFAVAEQVVNLKISSGDVENAKTICLIFGLKDVLKKFREKYPNKSIPTVIYLYFGEKTDWQEKLGENPVNEFLDVLPKSKERDEKRNAFTHNEYDRTSEFLQYLNKYELFNVNNIDFEITTDFIKHYGLAKSVLLYEYFRNLQLFNMGKLDNLPPEQVYEDEITSLEILEEKYKTLQMKVFSSQEITANYLKTLSHFEITLLSQITGKNTHRFDDGRPPFDQIIGDFIVYSEKATEKSGGQVDLSQDDNYPEYDDYDDYYQEDSYNYSRGEYVPTPEEYKSFKLQANKVEYEFDRSNLEKPDSSYNILKKDVLKIFSTETADKDKFLSLKTSVIEKIQAKIKELENKTDNQYIVQQREKLMSVIAKLEKLDFKEIKEKGEIKSQSYDELLLALLDLDKSMIERSGLQDELRQIVFRKMLDQGYGTVDRVERIRTSMQGELSALGILHLLDLIDNFAKDHILNTEKDNKEKYWTDEAWSKIKESNKIDSKFTMKVVFNKQHKDLKEVADKMTALDSGKGNFKVQCCPDRGFIGEMSGYLADVCYTAEYPLLARHPNLVPYKFIAEQDSDNKEFLGSVLVFELEDEDNNKVALLRAFDIPREHEVNVGEFVENFINKITPSLQARGVKKIIIPGDDGAISNYPLTISHMHKEYINGQNRMSLGKHFAFNGYDITDNCYVVREI